MTDEKRDAKTPNSAHSPPGPLKGLRVLDITQGLAGPYCAMLLAQHGADVIKVEPPSGDWSRTIGTPRGDKTASYIACNRGKRAMVLDLKAADDVATLKRLATKADVFMESNRAGVAYRLGIEYEAIRALNPEVIYLSVTGYGQTGPYRDRAVTDSIMQAFSGFMTRNLDHEGMAKRIEFAVPDYTTGLMAYQAVCTALLGRERGQHGGRFLDVSLMGAMLAYQQANIIDWEFGNHTVSSPMPPTGTYRTKDGLINISVIREKYFQALCKAIGLEKMMTDDRFSTLQARCDNEGALMAAIEPRFAEYTTAEIEDRFQECDVPHCRVNRYDEVVRNEQVIATGTVALAQDPQAGDYPVFAIPAALITAAEAADLTVPALGNSAGPVLEWLE